MQVVIVESPAKAKTINKYLGSDYTVLASFGHIRDLPSKDGSVDPNNNFAMSWQMDANSKKQVSAIKSALKGATDLWLATDPDREGEAISWHVLKVLEESGKLKNVNVHRVVFHEITKNAILNAFKNPKPLDDNLVSAYLARRALDYLFGFTLSPLLWRKLPGSRSAGRVQSVALRLICEREIEIENFISEEYWTVDGTFKNKENIDFNASLNQFNFEKLSKFSINKQDQIDEIVPILKQQKYYIADTSSKIVKRNPNAPFITSSLQQEASYKLGFTARKTMQVAQKLYEGFNIGGETVGLITYMRTDSVSLSQDAISQCRDYVGKNMDTKYLPEKPRVYKSKSKNAQEAHEAIRPTRISLSPKNVKGLLDSDHFRLYELIWNRTVASQMSSAQYNQMDIFINSSDDNTVFKASGRQMVFDGFLKIYDTGNQDTDIKNQKLPQVNINDDIALQELLPEQHFTSPPPRYNEASLVKKLEELGIGRPSTYANIISVLQDRNYVRLESRRFIPEDRGRIVTAFLEKWFESYVQYDFTADLEDKLDVIAAGELKWDDLLQEFWHKFNHTVEDLKELKISDVIDVLNTELSKHFFDGDNTCPKCKDESLTIKLGRHGAFIGCSNYPDCNYVRQLSKSDNEEENALEAEEKEIGIDPETNLPVNLKKGPYGWYVQLGEAEGKTKPKRASLGRNFNPQNLTLEDSLRLLALPREVGTYKATGETIIANKGRFGPYIQVGDFFANIKEPDNPYDISLDRASNILDIAIEKKKGIELGEHPTSKEIVRARAGRYGPIVETIIDEQTYQARAPKGTALEEIKYEQALEWLTESGKVTSSKKTKKEPAKKATKKKATAKKTTTKKKATTTKKTTTAKKTTAKKATAAKK